MNPRNYEHIHHINQAKECKNPNKTDKLVLISYC